MTLRAADGHASRSSTVARCPVFINAPRSLRTISRSFCAEMRLRSRASTCLPGSSSVSRSSSDGCNRSVDASSGIGRLLRLRLQRNFAHFEQRIFVDVRCQYALSKPLEYTVSDFRPVGPAGQPKRTVGLVSCVRVTRWNESDRLTAVGKGELRWCPNKVA